MSADNDRRLAIEILDDPYTRAAELIAAAATRNGTLALSGGSTPAKTYELAAGLGDWSDANIYLVDERYVAAGDQRSNARLVEETLLQGMKEHCRPNFHSVNTADELHAAADQYQDEIEAQLGSHPVFDLVLLGVGGDGHTASLFPGKPEVDETSRSVVAVPAPGLEPFVPRLSLTLPVINAAREIVFLITGGGKADVVRRVFGCEPDLALPASRVQPVDGRMTLLLDHAAAAHL